MPPNPDPSLSVCNAFLKDADWVSTLLTQIQKDRFHGRLVVYFYQGKAVRVVKEESLMPPHGETQGAQPFPR